MKADEFPAQFRTEEYDGVSGYDFNSGPLMIGIIDAGQAA